MKGQGDGPCWIERMMVSREEAGEPRKSTMSWRRSMKFDRWVTEGTDGGIGSAAR